MGITKLRNDFENGLIDKHTYIDDMHRAHQVLFEYKKILKDSLVKEIIINSNQVIFKMHNEVMLYVDPTDRRFIPIEILNFKSFDPMEKDLIENIVKKSRVILDVGANIGWYTLCFSDWNKNAQIHSFEPIPFTYSYLEKHIALNNCNNAKLNNFALSDESGVASFYWGRNETGSSSMRNIQERAEVELIECTLDTLDNYCNEQNLSIDFIKCDVEGAEFKVFKGGMKVIERDKPIIFTEMLRKWSAKFGYHPNEIINLLKSLGYRAFAFCDGKLKEFLLIDDSTLATNFFFFHSEIHIDYISVFSE